MDGGEMPVISCVLAPSLEASAHIELAERPGYRRVVLRLARPVRGPVDGPRPDRQPDR